MNDPNALTDAARDTVAACVRRVEVLQAFEERARLAYVAAQGRTAGAELERLDAETKLADVLVKAVRE